MTGTRTIVGIVTFADSTEVGFDVLCTDEWLNKHKATQDELAGMQYNKYFAWEITDVTKYPQPIAMSQSQQVIWIKLGKTQYSRLRKKVLSDKRDQIDAAMALHLGRWQGTWRQRV